MNNIETLVDLLSELLDEGLSVTEATQKILEKENFNVSVLHRRFTEVFLCSPEEYSQNVKDDAVWAEENGDILDVEFDDLLP